MANDAYIDTSEDNGNPFEGFYELSELNELNNLGVKNEHSNNDIGSVRNGKINQHAKHEPRRNIIDSDGSEAAPF